MLLQNVYVSFSVNDAFTDVQITHALDTNILPYNDRAWLLNFTPVTIWKVFSFFDLENKTSIISINNQKC